MKLNKTGTNFPDAVRFHQRQLENFNLVKVEVPEILNLCVAVQCFEEIQKEPAGSF